MSIDRNNDIVRLRMLLLPIAAGILIFSPPSIGADEAAHLEKSQFGRADADTIEMHTRQILSEPDMAARKSFWQWLWGKFSKWKKPDISLGPRLAKVILWVVIIWCVLTLLAILAHLIWTLILFVRPDVTWQKVTGGPASEHVKSMSCDELYERARKLAEKGAFTEAMSFVIVALLRLLDSLGTIRFHESKTNGDYIREYPVDHAGRSEFRQLVLIFERTIYGRLQSDRQAYHKMDSLMERIRKIVSQKA